MSISHIIRPIIFSLLCMTAPAFTHAQNAEKNVVVSLDLNRAIHMATDSSLLAFKYKNLYRSSYWEFRSHRANRLPSLTLGTTPLRYYRYLTQRYDSQNDIDVYREQRSLTSSVDLSLRQNFDPLGGSFFVTTSVERLQNFGASDYTQFSTVPIKIGYTNNILGYNEFRWERKVEPLKFEKAKLLYLFNAEYLSALAVEYFFNLAKAQAQYDLAQRQVTWCDTLLSLGTKRQQIASITQNDLQALRLDAVNARSSLTSAAVAVRRASMHLASFLGLPPDAELHLTMPGPPSIPAIDQRLALDMMHANSYELLDQQEAVLRAEQNLDKVRKQTMFQASLNASIGFNQQAPTLPESYSDPLRQDLVSVSLSIPILDWGVGRGKRNMARSQMEVARIEAQQKTAEKEQEVLITISELTSRHELLSAAEEALTLAESVYRQTMERFMAGAADMSRLNLAQQKLLTAQNSYIDCMYNYWNCFYSLRRQTLYDFTLGFSLAEEFDFNNLVE